MSALAKFTPHELLAQARAAHEDMAMSAILHHGAQQKLAELVALLSFISDRPPVDVLEIGSWTGGTLWMWAQLARYVVSIDLARNGPALGELPAPVHRIFGDSHDAAVLAQLGDQHFDLLFIDGDHSYRGVKRDFEMYAPLVREGGLVVLHDIVPHTFLSGIHVERFWSELRQQRRTVEFVDALPCPYSRQGSYDAGIGVVLT